MTKPINEMSDEEIEGEIRRLQSIKVPSAKPKVPKRVNASKEESNKKKTWRDELFG